MSHPDAREPARRPYVTPRLVEHGTIEALTAIGATTKQEKHPIDFMKGSKIRPKPR